MFSKVVEQTHGGTMRTQPSSICDRTRQTFDLPLAPAGEPFEQQVWKLMAAIPYGETRRYARLMIASG
jgi:methylated-DNA-[protein]-cysteine S-methyltransferase